ncbi:MAG: tRNA lysidine(34) synthetase TilS [Duncaniella sp.]|nr:tRNA lysidine(34) synthetase TilS [Duncaniella sp.]
MLPRDPRCEVTVGLSGGADSVALLRVLLDLGVRVSARHCNFGLRGEESDRDERFCRDLCARLGVELRVRRFDVGARRRETGESIEMACRELRYGWWREEGIETLAVAHHADDNAETLVMNLLRGTGIAGLKGMMPRNGHIVRPLLCVGRAEILDYLAELGQDYITDSSNASTDFTRNRIRNLLLPEIERLFPGGTDGIKRTVECLRDNYNIYKGMTDMWRDRYTDPADGSVDVAAIAAEGDAPDVILFELMHPRGLGMAECREVLRSAAGGSGQRFGDFVLDHGRLFAIPEGYGECEVRLDEPPFKIEIVSRTEFAVSPKRPDTLWADATILDGDPRFVLRDWRRGDRLAPYGMRGTRLVSDIYSDAHLGEARRRGYPLLLRDGVPLWVCGLRASRHYPVTPSTERVVKLTFDPRRTCQSSE